MSPALKRILLLIGFLFISFVIGWSLYTVFKKSDIALKNPSQQGTQKPGSQTFPGSGNRTSSQQAGSGGQGTDLPIANVVSVPENDNYYRPELVKQITEDSAFFSSVSLNGQLRYQNISDGKFYGIKNGQLEKLSDQVFYNVEKVTWAKTRNKAVIEYPDDTKIIYDFESKRQTTLPKHWEDFTFSPDGSEVASKSLGLAAENRWLITTKDDGTGTQLIEPLGDNADKVTMSWSPSKQVVAFSATGEPQGADRREILLIGLNGENFKSIIVEGLDFQPAWSPSGKKLLYSVDSARSEFKPELWVVNAYGDTIGSGRQMLGVYTWANKCTFADDNTLYCAVPRYLPEGAGMSPAIAADIPDDLFRIDVRSGIKTPISLNKDYTFSSISFDQTRKKVIFTDNHLTGAFEVSL